MSTCIYCKKDFSSIPSMVKHQKTAKYCLKLRGDDKTKHPCIGCNDVYTSKCKLDKHKIICIQYNVYKNLKEQALLHDIEIKNLHLMYEDRLNDMKTQLSDITSGLTEVAIAGATKSTTTNISVKLEKFDITTEQIDNVLSMFYDIKTLIGGNKAVGQLINAHLLNPEGKPSKYMCTDRARYIFKLMDETGKIIKDPQAKELTKLAQDPVIKHSEIVFNELYTSNDKDYKEANFKKANHQRIAAYNLGSDPKFSKGLAS